MESQEITAATQPKILEKFNISLKDLSNEIHNVEDAERISKHIINVSENPQITTIRLNRIRFYLRERNASRDIINATKHRDITIQAQKDRNDSDHMIQRKALVTPEYYRAELVNDRINNIDYNRPATTGNLIDFMIAMAARPADVELMDISEHGVIGVAKMRDDEKPRPYLSFAFNDNWQEASKMLEWIKQSILDKKCLSPTSNIHQLRNYLRQDGLKMSDLRKIGANHTAKAYNQNETIGGYMQLLRRALRHSDHNKPSSAEFYGNVSSTE